MHATNSDIEQGRAFERDRMHQIADLWQKRIIEGDPYSAEELRASQENGYENSFKFLHDLIDGEPTAIDLLEGKTNG